MKAADALTTVVKPSLAGVLGSAVTNLVMASAFSNLVRAVLRTPDERERLKTVVDELCRDPRLLSALGPARLTQMKEDWLRRCN
jgi:hypothetical protein